MKQNYVSRKFGTVKELNSKYIHIYCESIISKSWTFQTQLNPKIYLDSSTLKEEGWYGI